MPQRIWGLRTLPQLAGLGVKSRERCLMQRQTEHNAFGIRCGEEALKAFLLKLCDGHYYHGGTCLFIYVLFIMAIVSIDYLDCGSECCLRSILVPYILLVLSSISSCQSMSGEHAASSPACEPAISERNMGMHSSIDKRFRLMRDLCLSSPFTHNGETFIRTQTASLSMPTCNAPVVKAVVT